MLRTVDLVVSRNLLCGLAMASITLIGGCGDPAEPPPVPTTITISPASAALQSLEETVQLGATVQDQNGEAMSGVTVIWASGDSDVVRVDGKGLVTAAGNGVASVSASAESVAGTARVTVDQRPAEVRVSPVADTLVALGDTIRLAAEAFDANGHRVGDTEFTWSSGDESVVAIDAGGLATAVGDGTTSVTASAESVVGTAQVTVYQRAVEVRVLPGADTLWVAESLQLVAEAFDANGNALTNAVFTWSSGDESVATVDGTGLVTGRGGGSVEVTVAESTAGLTGSVLLLVVDARGELVALYEALGGASWYRRDNWGTDAPLETWYGVTTDGQGGIAALELGVNGLSGALTPRIALLKSLETLHLHRNRLTGPIPSELGGLQNLTSLKLDDNRLTGPIPSELGGLRNLTSLALDGNILTGPIPSELGDLRDLAALRLDGNELTGSIPAELGSLRNLTVLRLNGNGLSGSIPSELGNLQHLDSLRLHSNGLSGSIPPELGNVEKLASLSLYHNALSGSIPPEPLCAMLTDDITAGYKNIGRSRIT